jgi:hypothetical protein
MKVSFTLKLRNVFRLMWSLRNANGAQQELFQRDASGPVRDR